MNFQVDDMKVLGAVEGGGRTIKNVKSADLFIPKKISFYTKWLENAINDFKKSSKLHLTYQTN